jgi:glutamate synthase (NADPH/NADH) large chain
MIAAGCVMARQCHLNTCPTGVATQDEKLRKRFRGSVQGITAYFKALAREVREIMAVMGVSSMSEIIARKDLLSQDQNRADRASRINLEPLLSPYPVNGPRYCTMDRNENPAPSFNKRIAADLAPAIEKAQPVAVEYKIRNIDRSIPVTLNYLIAQKYGDQGLPDNSLQLTFKGTAGQSFGAFNHRGVSLILLGDANDYAGKGMFGGRIVIIPADLRDTPEQHVIVGNTVLYGATGGEFYAAGTAGERFGVRNSGAVAVIEGAGHHLCEYMTGGSVAVLGDTGYNIGAGMTGGVIYIMDRQVTIEQKINRFSVQTKPLEQAADIASLRNLIIRHFRHTGSLRADYIINDFSSVLPLFRKVTPLIR